MSGRPRVAIIGGGTGGIVAVKECLDEGFEPVCFEQHDQIGGLWYYTEHVRNNQGAAIYPTLITNTSKGMTEFSDFPMPKDYPPYLPHHYVYEYLQNYADHFQLRDYFHLNTEVVKIEKSQYYDRDGSWSVSWKKTDSQNAVEHEIFPFVIVANGFARVPYTPTIPGADTYGGIVVHSQQFRHAHVYEGKRVLVIGNANSAGDVATEISHHAKCVFMSVGNGMNVATRLREDGTPLDFSIGRWVYDFIPMWARIQMFTKPIGNKFDHELFGCLPEKGALASAFAMNDELGWRIMSGKVITKPFVTEFTETGVIFADGSTLGDIDAVIFGTGYSMNYDIIGNGVLSDKETTNPLPVDMDLFKSVWPLRNSHNTLALLGVFSSLGPSPCILELQSRWVTQVFGGNVRLPRTCVMEKAVKDSKTYTTENFGGRLRVEHIPYADELADFIGAKPKFWKQLMIDPALACVCYFGPAFPVQYRLCGPHTWAGARRAVMESYKNTFGGLRTRVANVSTKKKNSRRYPVVLPLLLIITASAVVYAAKSPQGNEMYSMVTHSLLASVDSVQSYFK